MTPSNFDLVDLTGDTSESSVAGDEVIVSSVQVVARDTRNTRDTHQPREPPEPRDTVHYRSADSGRNRDTSPWKHLFQTRNQPPPPVKAPTLDTSSSVKRVPIASPASKLPLRNDGTPSKTARFGDSRAPRSRPSSSRGIPQHPTPQSAGQLTPRNQTPKKKDWTVDRLVNALGTYSEAVGKGHSRLVQFMLEEAEKKAPQPRHLSDTDAFADMRSIAVDNNDNSALAPEVRTMVIKFKQHNGDHGKGKGGGRRSTFPIVCIKTDKAAVPRYRFHHVEIRKNILTPNTMLNFVPHLRDVDPNSAEEMKYSNWLGELEKLDSQSGFKTQDRGLKHLKRVRDEYAATLSMYLEPWLRKLAIEGCTKSSLIRYMASQTEKDDAITPQQKSSLLDSYSEDMDSPQAIRGAKMFTEAFNRVFDDSKKICRANLRDILLLDKSVETIVDNKRAKETPSSQKQRDQDLMPRIESALASYSILGCLICFSHDCEHGEFDAENQRGTFSIEGTGGIARALKEKWASQLGARKTSQQNGSASKRAHPPCNNQCYRTHDIGVVAQPLEPWAENEIQVLERVFATLGYSATLEPHCFVAAVLDRRCWDVYRKFKELDLVLPPVEPPTENFKVKPVSWYDRKKKQLLGDWQDCTTSHEHASRELSEPCHHEGPCNAANKCPCQMAYPHPVLCERFCHCTADTCALKFTGCACHSTGKTCLQRQKEGKPCICVQLNRECDPVLCKGCGARDRADPENCYDEQLHSTGCQNVALQRGASRVVMLGKSQLEGCGYGLFTAEDILQDGFVIEYTGELITHDEGVRREARRGDVFNEESNSSYLFTLLEHEGIWVDAAIYGNLSRYINHASEYDRKACNITPKILYVNGEYRIKFTTLRDIKAGEELFFNYGDNFPNLTKKLLEQDEDKPNDNGNSGAAAAQKRKNSQRGVAARKSTAKVNEAELSKAARGRARKTAPDPGASSAEDEMPEWANIPHDEDDEMADDWGENTPRRRKKRGGRRPGAGRKKKQPVPNPNADVMDIDRSREISDSQAGDTPNGKTAGGDDTPTRRRLLARVFTHPSESEIGVKANVPKTAAKQPQPGQQPVKKASKRGGARPGAGRKPKHPRPPIITKPDTPTSTSTANNNIAATKSAANGPEDSDDAPLVETVRDRVSSEGGFDRLVNSSTNSVNGAGRKRKADDLELSPENEEAMAVPLSTGGASPLGGGGPYREYHFQLIDDFPGSSVGGDDDDDDGLSLADRSARKRQKPLRYRVDEQP
ncbi:hypothetical protein B0T26DRAFT_630959 [Lasiosphaeria miniovina]|uniref:Histone-lysine N-methyltransferase EZH2 n=1 Tax=Lasiosphaeria miniovina TaxID=1954250 RepID=A0AA40EEE4_9PEZI|nr:uncharacterized protein B0T26DRAFT_630959 [Lasiosphaeria miniovina]KAK0734406.1 hypothetical protein B0T26DRAFT_630959 [Lasiosphaeria miniovina]